MSGLPPLDELLAYDRHLEGEAFTRAVMSRTARRSHRAWILGGAALLSLAVAMAIKPDDFTLFADFHLPLHLLSDAAVSVSAGGLVAALLVAALVIGTSKTIDSI